MRDGYNFILLIIVWIFASRRKILSQNILCRKSPQTDNNLSYELSILDEIDFLILTAADNSTVSISPCAEPTTPPCPVRTEIRTIKRLNLLSNWIHHVPTYLQPYIRVYCADKACKRMMSTNHPHIHISNRQIEYDKGIALNWRVKEIDYLLSQNKTVLVSDPDAIWFQDPIPFLLARSENIVAMYDGWSKHSVNCGFILFRPSSRPIVQRWVDSLQHSFKKDQMAMHWVASQFLWHEDRGVGPEGKTIGLLPPKSFTRYASYLEGCVNGTSDDYLTCINNETIVYHGKEQIILSKEDSSYVPRAWLNIDYE